MCQALWATRNNFETLPEKRVQQKPMAQALMSSILMSSCKVWSILLKLMSSCKTTCSSRSMPSAESPASGVLKGIAGEPRLHHVGLLGAEPTGLLCMGISQDLDRGGWLQTQKAQGIESLPSRSTPHSELETHAPPPHDHHFPLTKGR